MSILMIDEFSTIRNSAITLKAEAEDVPCRETSDPARLCKQPVVSVNMTAYNHEKYIAEAIEGVVMQKTDFEFELVIGEDCSKDRTREICLDYQRRYPDKIRVLWSDKNVYSVRGNLTRISARCRGEFMAICEGDDRWTDPFKLQKQVDIMRRNPNVGLCFCGADIVYEDTGETKEWNADRRIKPGLIPGRRFFLWHLFGTDPRRGTVNDPATFLMTASVMLRKSVRDEARAKYDILRWKLTLTDTTTWLGVSSLSDVYYLEDKVSIYRRNAGSALGTIGMRVGMDADLVRAWYAMKVLGVPYEKLPSKFRQDAMLLVLGFQLADLSTAERRAYFRRVWRLKKMRSFFFSPRGLLAVAVGSFLPITPRVMFWTTRVYSHLFRHFQTVGKIENA